MMNIRHKTIQINRLVLMKELTSNLAAHEIALAEALADYRALTVKNLRLALKQINAAETDEAATKITVKFVAPPDHRKDYIDAIEMLEYSVSDNIELDQDSFKAYVKNEWSWSKGFLELAGSYKSAL